MVDMCVAENKRQKEQEERLHSRFFQALISDNLAA